MLLSFAFQWVSGCTTIDYGAPPPNDWPELEVIVIPATPEEVHAICGNGMIAVFACAFPRFSERRCHIYLTSGSSYLLEHEMAHCRGYDHPGEKTMADAWQSYRETLIRQARVRDLSR